MLDTLCTLLGINKAALVPGLIGGGFSLRWVPQVGWLGTLAAILYAGTVANYLTAPVHHWIQVARLPHAGLAFVIGLFATTLTATCFKAVQDIKGSDLFTRFTGGKP